MDEGVPGNARWMVMEAPEQGKKLNDFNLFIYFSL